VLVEVVPVVVLAAAETSVEPELDEVRIGSVVVTDVVVLRVPVGAADTVAVEPAVPKKLASKVTGF